MNNSLQKDEYYLPGGFNDFIFNGAVHKVISIEKRNDQRGTTITCIREEVASNELENGKWSFVNEEPKELHNTVK